MQTAALSLTKSVIDALPLPEPGKRKEYRDKEVKGLVLRVTSAGAKTWCVICWDKVRHCQERVTLGTYPAMQPKQARDLARRLVGDYASGINPAEKRRKERQRATFAELFESYYENHAKPHKRSHREDWLKYQKHLAKPLGKQAIADITKQDIAGIHARLTKAGTPTAANRVHALLGSIFSYGMRSPEFGLAVSPTVGAIAKKNPETTRERFVQPHEIPAFMRAVADEPNQEIADFALLGLFTGARSANVSSMRWADLHTPEGLPLYSTTPSNVARLVRAADAPDVWKIPLTKNGETHTVPLVSQARQILDKRWAARGSSPFVFPGNGKKGHMVEPKTGWLRITSRAEAYALLSAFPTIEAEATRTEASLMQRVVSSPVATLAAIRQIAQRLEIDLQGMTMTDLHIHDLRRSLGSWMTMNGSNEATVGKALGHKVRSVTAIYSRSTPAHVLAAMQSAIDKQLGISHQSAPHTAEPQAASG